MNKKRFVWLESKRADRIIHFNVWIGYFVSKLLGVFLVRSRRADIVPADVVHGSRYIIAANHQSLLDPFMICGQFPVRVWWHMGTLRYFTANGLFRAPILREILMGLGCFPARTTPRWPSGLEYGLKQLSLGKTVLIFPEGRRTVRGHARTRNGVEVLAHSHQAMVVPAHIEWRVHGKFFRSFRIGIGKPFDGTHLSAQEILDRVYAVPVR